MTEPTGNEPIRSEDVPIDRLTRICDAMLTAMHAHPEFEAADKVVIMLDNGTRGGCVMEGYDSDEAAVRDILRHTQALAKVNGWNMAIFSADQLSGGPN